jgi:hypothetical protein
LINIYSQVLQIDVKERLVLRGKKKTKSYSDVAFEVYGESGRQFVAFHIVSYTICCCMAYVLFFVE